MAAAQEAWSVKLTSLRTHSWYSLLEGVDSPEAIAEAAASRGYESVAVTDTNTVGGAVEFAAACQRAGVRPIVGARLLHKGKRATVLVAEAAGWRSLCSAISRCHLDGKADLPETLAACHHGLHACTSRVNTGLEFSGFACHPARGRAGW